MNHTPKANRVMTVDSSSEESFNPIGTAVVLGLYFALLVGLWIVMYFVEFIGRGPTILAQ